jgi:hypothetical protein
MNRDYHFIVKQAEREVDRFSGTMTYARRRGDHLANALGKAVDMYCYNNSTYRWERLATYHGHMNVTNAFGERLLIKPDFSGMQHRKEVQP